MKDDDLQKLVDRIITESDDWQQARSLWAAYQNAEGDAERQLWAALFRKHLVGIGSQGAVFRNQGSYKKMRAVYNGGAVATHVAAHVDAWEDEAGARPPEAPAQTPTPPAFVESLLTLFGERSEELLGDLTERFYHDCEDRVARSGLVECTGIERSGRCGHCSVEQWSGS